MENKCKQETLSEVNSGSGKNLLRSEDLFLKHNRTRLKLHEPGL